MFRKPNYSSSTAFVRRLINVATMSENLCQKQPHDTVFARHNRLFTFCLSQLNVSEMDIEKYRWQNEFDESDYWRQVYRFIRCAKTTVIRICPTGLADILNWLLPVLNDDYQRFVIRDYQLALDIIRMYNGSDVVQKVLNNHSYAQNMPRLILRHMARHYDYRVREAVYNHIDLLDENLKRIVLANI